MLLPKVPRTLYEFAAVARRSGYRRIAGIDEAGRGPLAGPVVASAVILPDDLELEGLNDSKQVNQAMREALYQELVSRSDVHIGVAEIHAEEIDRVNIFRATVLAMRRAACDVEPDFIFVDGRPVHALPAPSRGIVKGDAKCASISAASIIAKVHRDRLMVKYEEDFPGYGFAQHKGYATQAHLEALRRLGPCPIHRKTFAPVAACLDTRPVQGEFPFLEESLP